MLFDVDEPDCSEDIKKLFDVWWKLSQKLFLDIRDILIQENEKGANYIVDGIGQYYVVKPFMERNGYRDGAGWWLLEDKV